MSLNARAWLSLAILPIMMGLLVFVPALDHRLNVGQGQSVISTGPYAIVRHPMYASASLYLLGTPLALGSYWGISAMLVMMPALIWRLIDEERMLARSLPGYTDYQRRVRHRLVPFVW